MATADGEASWAQDLAGGCAVAALGLGAVLVGRTYGIGSLRRMEPGFFPVALGALLCFLGMAMALAALKARAQRPDGGGGSPFVLPDRRGGVCIVLGVAAFLVVGRAAGLAPAAFACVFLSALGDRTMGWRRALAFAAAVAVLGTLLFSFVLAIQMPVVWGWPS